MTDALPGLASEAKSRGKILASFIGVLWLIQIVNAVVFSGGLFGLGIHPRTLLGLMGIALAPFLHASFAHLIANTVPLVILGWLVMLRRKRDLVAVSALAALIGGLGTWLVAPALTVHAGASVLVFGYLGYLLSRGVFERRFWPIVGSFAALFLYGGTLWGVLPTEIGVSWQSHLFGLIGGVLAARLLRAPRRGRAAPEQARRRVASSDEARLRLPSDAEREAEIEAELTEAKQRLKAGAGS